MFVTMQNPPFSLLYKRHSNIILNSQDPFQETHFNENEEKQLIEEIEPKDPKFLLQHPCEYFIFFSIMAVWLGNYTRRKLHDILTMINK